MSNPYRDMIAELLKALESWSPCGGGPLEDADEIAEANLIARARTLMAQPEAEWELMPLLRDAEGLAEVFWAQPVAEALLAHPTNLDAAHENAIRPTPASTDLNWVIDPELVKWLQSMRDLPRHVR